MAEMTHFTSFVGVALFSLSLTVFAAETPSVPLASSLGVSPVEPITNCEKARQGSVAPLQASKQTPAAWKEIKRVFVIVLENTDYAKAIAQPFLQNIAKTGALLTNSRGVTHPSQPNYVAMIHGATHGVNSNDQYSLSQKNLGDLLLAKGRTWKTYAEGYPGNCFLKSKEGQYVRKHNPFLSSKAVQANPELCKKVVPSTELEKDIQEHRLPDFAFYIPNNDSNGHDTGVAFADQAIGRRFRELVKDPDFMNGTLLVITFDESGTPEPNHIYTTLLGAGIQVGAKSNTCYDHYSLLRTIEMIFDLGDLGQKDSKSPWIEGIWKSDLAKK